MKERNKMRRRWKLRRIFQVVLGYLQTTQGMVGGAGAILYFGVSAILTGGTAGVLPKLPAEMFYISITARFGNLQNGFPGADQMVLCQAQSSFTYVIHAGYIEFVFVEGLKISGA